MKLDVSSTILTFGTARKYVEICFMAYMHAMKLCRSEGSYAKYGFTRYSVHHSEQMNPDGVH